MSATLKSLDWRLKHARSVREITDFEDRSLKHGSARSALTTRGWGGMAVRGTSSRVPLPATPRNDTYRCYNDDNTSRRWRTMTISGRHKILVVVFFLVDFSPLWDSISQQLFSPRSRNFCGQRNEKIYPISVFLDLFFVYNRIDIVSLIDR